MNGKFYWLKLKKDFFKRHDIRIIESLPDGKEIVLFYLKLMLESVDHEGELRFSEELPFSEQMLSTITNTDVSIVTSALDTLSQFGLVETDESGTIILPKVMDMIDSASDTDSARRQKRYRERKKEERNESLQQNVTHVTSVTTKDNESKSKSKSYIERNTKERKFSKPTLEEVISYCQERNNDVDAERFINYYESKGWKVGSTPMKDWKAAVRTWEKNSKPTPVHCPPSATKYDINWDEV